jgi:hypothetical protein
MKRLVRYYQNGKLYTTTVECTPIAYFKAFMWKLGQHRNWKRSYDITKI